MNHLIPVTLYKSFASMNFVCYKSYFCTCLLYIFGDMTNLIFGIGIGLFIILILWAVALLIFIVSLRVEKKIGTIAILIVGICTIILIALPKTTEKAGTTEKKIYDHLFVWRIILLVLLSISSVIGFLGYIKFSLTESVRPVRISNWIF